MKSTQSVTTELPAYLLQVHVRSLEGLPGANLQDPHGLVQKQAKALGIGVFNGL